MTLRWFIGTSGWHYPHWRGVFYPEKLPSRDWLDFYARHFDSVEINSSFYRLPTEQAVARWQRVTPDDFHFAAKGSRFISHMKKLSNINDSLVIFIDRLSGLGHKLGPVLFQTPPSWRKDMSRLAAFLSLLPRGREWVFEFRHSSWHCEETYRLLHDHQAAFCIYDLAGFTSPAMITTDFAYLRLHGPAAAYCGRYGEERLAPWVEWLAKQSKLRQVYAYFDNDQAAYAAEDARLFRQLAGLPVLP
jgi:uncharacterized protein YecE (DUF72 family)